MVERTFGAKLDIHTLQYTYAYATIGIYNKQTSMTSLYTYTMVYAQIIAALKGYYQSRNLVQHKNKVFCCHWQPCSLQCCWQLQVFLIVTWTCPKHMWARSHV